MSEPQKEYIITENELDEHSNLARKCGVDDMSEFREPYSYEQDLKELEHTIRSRSYTSAEKVLDKFESWIRHLKVQEEDIWFIERTLKKLAELRQQEREQG